MGKTKAIMAPFGANYVAKVDMLLDAAISTLIILFGLLRRCLKLTPQLDLPSIKPLVTITGTSTLAPHII